MNHTSCIRHPEKNPYVQLHEWQLRLCQGKHCPALILSFFAGWHDWKLNHDDYYRRYNNIAEMHGDDRPHNESAYLFFTMEQLIAGLLYSYKKQAINEGIEFLISLGLISVHKNPNPRYHFDKTRYFKFYPEKCNEWIAEHYPLIPHKKNREQVIDKKDRPKMADAKTENRLAPTENSPRAAENGQAITNTTNHTTNKTHSLTASEGDVDENELALLERPVLEKMSSEIKPIVDALMAKGMPRKRFYPDAIAVIAGLSQAGATVNNFEDAYDKAEKRTEGQFGINYLARIIEDLLAVSKKVKSGHSQSPPVSQSHSTEYQNNFSNGLDWMGDLVNEKEKDDELARTN